MLLAASTQTSVGVVLLVIAVVVALVYAFLNVRMSKPEVGSEIELAANRKPYYSDEELEGKKLDRTLTWGLLGLFVIAIGLPLYWLQEPSRQTNAVGDTQRKFIDRGEKMFAPTADGGFNCAFCHGTEGVGGVTPYTVTDPEGRFVKAVEWKGPALNTVLLRYTRDEVRYVLTYGRPFSPMPAWGAKGGGPLTEQQLQNLIDYMGSFQLTPEEAQAEVAEELDKMMEARDPQCVAARTEAARAELTGEALTAFKPADVDTDDCPARWKSEGEALFNMGYEDGFAGGAYSCGRCHTQNWSYGEKEVDGGGAMGPNLRNVKAQFPGGSLGLQQQVDFVCVGSADGARYGKSGMGSGKMPGFCITPEVKLNPLNYEINITPQEPGLPEDGGMYTEDQVRAVVEYERSLSE